MTSSLLADMLANANSTQSLPSQSPPAQDAFKPRYVTVGQHKVRYARHEQGDRPNLVLLNGFPQSIRMWQSAWPALCESFNILAFDIPGFGLSSAQPSEMSPRNLGRIVINIMDYFEIQQAHLVGPDVGVPVALSAALLAPHRFHSLNIFDGPGHNPPHMAPVLKAVINYRLVRWLAKGFTKKSVMKTNFVTAARDGYHHYRPTAEAIKEYYEICHDQQRHECSIDFFGSYNEDLPWIHNQLTQLQVPTLITWGKQDPFVLVSNAEYLANTIPATKLVIFENASHFSSEDAGKDYTDTLSQWFLEGYKAC